MLSSHSFHAIIQDAGGGGAYVNVPFDVEETFGKKRVKVVATLDGVAYRGSLVRMGGECHLLPVLKSIRQQIGKDIGDEIEVTVEEDVQPRVMEVPADLQEALAKEAAALAIFEKLSYTHQKEYVRWIEEAKRIETRQRRVEKTLEMLKEGKSEH